MIQTEPQLDAANTALVVIDVQEKLVAAMPDEGASRCVKQIDNLLEAARLFEIPVIVTEQYPKGLGATVGALRERLRTFEEAPHVIEKVEFDATSNAGFNDGLEHLHTQQGDGQIRNLIVTGMEAHICVFQTARGLIGGGYHVHVPSDATCSRRAEDRRIAERLWHSVGASVTCGETILFDLLGSSKHEHFRAISRLLR